MVTIKIFCCTETQTHTPSQTKQPSEWLVGMQCAWHQRTIWMKWQFFNGKLQQMTLIWFWLFQWMNVNDCLAASTFAVAVAVRVTMSNNNTETIYNCNVLLSFFFSFSLLSIHFWSNHWGGENAFRCSLFNSLTLENYSIFAIQFTYFWHCFSHNKM